MATPINNGELAWKYFMMILLKISIDMLTSKKCKGENILSIPLQEEKGCCLVKENLKSQDDWDFEVLTSLQSYLSCQKR